MEYDCRYGISNILKIKKDKKVWNHGFDHKFLEYHDILQIMIGFVLNLINKWQILNKWL